MKKKQEQIIFIKYYMQELDLASLNCPLSSDYATFSLRNLSNSARLDTHLTFTSAETTPVHGGYRFLPVFNNDGQFYTPSFLLDADKIKCRQNRQLFSTNFVRSQLIDHEQTESIMVPRPATSKNFCFVCRTNFQDYLTHLAQPTHQTATHKNQFNKHILKLSKRFTPKTTKARGRGRPAGSKNKSIRKITAKREESETSDCWLDNLNGIEVRDEILLKP